MKSQCPSDHPKEKPTKSNSASSENHLTVPPKDLDKLLGIIEEIASANYSKEIMEFTKPENPEGVRRLAEAIGMMMVKIEAREFRLGQLVKELNSAHDQLKENILQTIITIANALGVRDEDSHEHAYRVSIYAKRLALRAGLSEKEAENVRIGGRLHDIGKIGFSDAIFKNEDTNVSDDMLDEIQDHPEIGVSILENLPFLEEIIDFVHYHHERLDGTGYPLGLKGKEIPIGAQIIAVADCFDAMTSERPYQKAKTQEEAITILRKLAGHAFPKKLVEEFISDLRENGKPIFDPEA